MARGRYQLHRSSTPGSYPQEACPIFHLPAELRCTIYEYACDTPGEYRLSGWLRGSPTIDVMLTCRRIYTELLPIFKCHRRGNVVLEIARTEANHGLVGAIRALKSGALNKMQSTKWVIGTPDNSIVIISSPRLNNLWDRSVPAVELSTYDRILYESTSWMNTMMKREELTPTYLGRRSADAMVIGAVKPSEVDWRRMHLAEIVRLCIDRNHQEAWARSREISP
ncbi:hypothetical protein LTR95_009694 [Oleoguttula sp. CCFEE 5521]